MLIHPPEHTYSLERIAVLRITLAASVLVILLFGPYGSFYDELVRVLSMHELTTWNHVMTHGGRRVVRLIAIVAASLLLVGYKPTLSAITLFSAFGVLEYWSSSVAPIVWNYDTHLLFFLVVLALAPCGARYSICSRWYRRENEADQKCRASTLLWLMQGWVGLLYFQAGVSKLLLVGPKWFLTGQSLLVSLFRQETPAGAWLAQSPQTVRALAILVGLFELSFVALLLNRRLHAFLGLAAIVFHLATWVFLGISFWHLWILYPALLIGPSYFPSHVSQCSRSCEGKTGKVERA